jgi:hypothetical protein
MMVNVFIQALFLDVYNNRHNKYNLHLYATIHKTLTHSTAPFNHNSSTHILFASSIHSRYGLLLKSMLTWRIIIHNTAWGLYMKFVAGA